MTPLLFFSLSSALFLRCCWRAGRVGLACALADERRRDRLRREELQGLATLEEIVGLPLPALIEPTRAA